MASQRRKQNLTRSHPVHQPATRPLEWPVDFPQVVDSMQAVLGTWLAFLWASRARGGRRRPESDVPEGKWKRSSRSRG